LQKNRVLTVQGNKDAEGQPVQVWKKAGGKNQKWSILYLEDKKPDTSTTWGGFDIGMPFYACSRMPMERCITTDSNRLRQETLRRGDLKQQFYLDRGTKTIKSQ